MCPDENTIGELLLRVWAVEAHVKEVGVGLAHGDGQQHGSYVKKEIDGRVESPKNG